MTRMDDDSKKLQGAERCRARRKIGSYAAFLAQGSIVPRQHARVSHQGVDQQGILSRDAAPQ
jgi:hypothetical protein